MERRQITGTTNITTTATRGVLSGASISFSTAGAVPSHTGPGATYGTAVPASSWPSNELSTTAPTSLAGFSDLQSPFSDAAATFFSNKGAMAGVFAGLGVLLISLCAIVYLGWIRNRRRNSRTPRSRDMNSIRVSDTFPEFKMHHGTSPAYPYLGSEPLRPTSGVSPSISSRHISMASLAGWWERRRGERLLQFRGTFHDSPSSSVVGEEDTQWTLGKVLESQRHQMILPLSPIPKMLAQTPRLPHAPPRELLAPRGRNGDGEGEGGSFTLEDALLPSLSSSPALYELGSTRTGRHPYAQ